MKPGRVLVIGAWRGIGFVRRYLAEDEFGALMHTPVLGAMHSVLMDVSLLRAQPMPADNDGFFNHDGTALAR